MNRQQISLELAQKLIAAALEEARQQEVKIAATVVDAGGHLVAFARMDTVGYLAVDITRRKALTAYNFQMPNDALVHLGQNEPAIAVDLAKNAEVCMLAGGLPIQIDSFCIGGLGIGGASSDLDRIIAEKAISLVL
jgi:glc operon protein GlcG